jgi:hypothetical protein
VNLQNGFLLRLQKVIEVDSKEISGIIIAGEIDNSLKMAILANRNVKTMTYRMNLILEETI